MMATATAAPGTDTLEQEAKGLEGEIAGLREKIVTEERNLARLRGEQQQLVEAIGLKKRKPSEAVELAAEIAGAESVIGGLNQLIGPKQSRLDEVLTQQRFRREDTQRAAELGKVNAIRAEGEALAKRIANGVAAMRVDLDRYFELRGELEKMRHAAPATLSAARDTRVHLDRITQAALAPLLKLLGR